MKKRKHWTDINKNATGPAFVINITKAYFRAKKYD